MAVDSFNTRTGAVVSAGSDYGWTVSGNDTNFALSGKVGIGTTSPGGKLDVPAAGARGSFGARFSNTSNYGVASMPTSAVKAGAVAIGYYPAFDAGYVSGDIDTGFYGFVPTGGHGGGASAATFDRPDTNLRTILMGGTSVSDSIFVQKTINTSTGATLFAIDASGNVGISASGHLNFGSASGASGYGLRDNSGAIQVKNSDQANWINIQQFLNVKSFGATGTSNDTSVLQAAFNTAASSELYIPSGLYMIDPLTLSNLTNVTIRGAGQGATILRMRTTNASLVMITATNCNNLMIRDLTLDGNYPNTSGISGLVINTSLTPKVVGVEVTGCGPQTGSISLSGCIGGMVRGCHVYGPTTGTNNSHGITIVSSAQCIVAENVVEQQANAGIQIFNSSGISITGNVCSTTVETSGAGFGGIRLADECYSCAVTGNAINGYGRGIFLAGVIYTTVSGNTIRFCNYEGIFVEATADGTAANTNYNVISNNTIRDPCVVGADGGIVLSKHTGTNCAGNIVIGNTIIDGRSPARITKALINATGDTSNKFPTDSNTTNIATLGP